MMGPIRKKFYTVDPPPRTSIHPLYRVTSITLWKKQPLAEAPPFLRSSLPHHNGVQLKSFLFLSLLRSSWSHFSRSDDRRICPNDFSTFRHRLDSAWWPRAPTLPQSTTITKTTTTTMTTTTTTRTQRSNSRCYKTFLGGNLPKFSNIKQSKQICSDAWTCN